MEAPRRPEVCFAMPAPPAHKVSPPPLQNRTVVDYSGGDDSPYPKPRSQHGVGEDPWVKSTSAAPPSSIVREATYGDIWLRGGSR